MSRADDYCRGEYSPPGNIVAAQDDSQQEMGETARDYWKLAGTWSASGTRDSLARRTVIHKVVAARPPYLTGSRNDEA